MSTLLFRLDGPLQSWGTDSKFEIRRTEMIPTKSGIIGLLAAASGKRRDADLTDLKKLNIGIRVDKPGVVISDFHVAGSGMKKSYITRRYYLSDAAFTVGIESDNLEKLEELKEALESPEYPLFLGRRSCPPGQPLCPHIVDESLVEALSNANWADTDRKQPETYRIFIEGKHGIFVRQMMDEPKSFDFHHRQYELRTVSEISKKNPHYAPDIKGVKGFETGHDPFMDL